MSEFSFEPTSDYKLVQRILCHPRVFDHITDDFTPSREEFRVIENPLVKYLLVRDVSLEGNGELLGLWAFVEQNPICWEAHTAFLPVAWGGRARRSAPEMPRWIFSNTGCLRIFASIPAYNTRAVRFMEATGMKRFGVNKASFMKDGKLHDQILLGLSKGDVCQQH